MAETSNLPCIVGRTADGRYRVIRREVFYNDEGFPLFATRIGESGFPTADDAREHARTAVVEFEGAAADDRP